MINRSRVRMVMMAMAMVVMALVALAATKIPSASAAIAWALTRAGSTVKIDDGGQVLVQPAAGKKTTFTRAVVPYSTKTALTAGSSVTVDSTLGNFFTLTPGETESINATTVGAQGQPLLLQVVTSGTSSFTLTFNTNFKSTGTLATGTTSAKTFMVTFISDGTNYVEVSRTAAQ